MDNDKENNYGELKSEFLKEYHDNNLSLLADNEDFKYNTDEKNSHLIDYLADSPFGTPQKNRHLTPKKNVFLTQKNQSYMTKNQQISNQLFQIQDEHQLIFRDDSPDLHRFNSGYENNPHFYDDDGGLSSLWLNTPNKKQYNLQNNDQMQFNYVSPLKQSRANTNLFELKQSKEAPPNNLQSKINLFKYQEIFSTPNKQQKNDFQSNLNSSISRMSQRSDDNDYEQKARCSRGLRVLSLKVKEIVCERKQTTYKQVAEILINELKQNQKLLNDKNDEISKDEQNVKRRVYDALNVLIAAGILAKEGKMVMSHDASSLIGQSFKKNADQTKDSYNKQIKLKKESLLIKRKNLKDLVDKSIAYNQLLDRNYLAINQQIMHQNYNKNNQRINRIVNKLFKQDPEFQNKLAEIKKAHSDKEIVQFPFIILGFLQENNQISINAAPDRKSMSLQSSGGFNLYGDMDILLKLQMQYANQDYLSTLIPQEIQKYINIHCYDNQQSQKQ